MVEIQGRHINPNTVESVEVWGERLLVSGATRSKGCIIRFTSGRKWKCGWHKTQVVALLTPRDLYRPGTSGIRGSMQA